MAAGCIVWPQHLIACHVKYYIFSAPNRETEEVCFAHFSRDHVVEWTINCVPYDLFVVCPCEFVCYIEYGWDNGRETIGPHEMVAHQIAL